MESANFQTGDNRVYQQIKLCAYMKSVQAGPNRYQMGARQMQLHGLYGNCQTVKNDKRQTDPVPQRRVMAERKDT